MNISKETVKRIYNQVKQRKEQIAEFTEWEKDFQEKVNNEISFLKQQGYTFSIPYNAYIKWEPVIKDYLQIPLIEIHETVFEKL